MKKRKYKYFVSYFYREAKGVSGYGNIELTYAVKVENGVQIAAMRDYIDRQTPGTKSVILNFQFLARVE